MGKLNHHSGKEDKNATRWPIVFVVGLLFISSPVFRSAQDPAAKNRQAEIDKSLLMLNSPQLEERYSASEILKKFTREELGPAALFRAKKLFLDEIQRIRRFREFAVKPKITLDKIPRDIQEINSDTWKLYFSNLRDIAAKSAEVDLLPQLLEYQAAPGEMMGYGDSAVDAAIRVLRLPVPKAEFPDVGRQLYATRLLSEFMREKDGGYVARGEARKKIAKAFADIATSEEADELRICIIKSLGELGDETFVAVLEAIAQNDQSRYEAKSNPKIEKDLPAGQTVVRYPVRKYAQDALERIKRKKAK